MRSQTTRAIAALASLIGHVWVASILLTIDPHRDLANWEPLPGMAAPGSGFSTDSATLVFIEEEGAARAIDRPAPPRIEEGGIVALTIRVLDPVTPELSDLDDDAEGTVLSAEPTSIEGTDRAALIERYLGLIHARVERAWDREPGAARAFCRVHVKQDARGEVLDIATPKCALQPLDRESLLAAVRRASPLPAPPDVALFLPDFLLEFGEPDVRL